MSKISPLIYGALCVPIGFMIGVIVCTSAIGSGYWMFIVVAPIAIFITGSIFWQLIMNKLKYVRAVLVAFLTAAFSHWLCWYMLIVLNYAFGGSADPINPIVGISASVFYSFFSLLFYGLFTFALTLLVALAAVKFFGKS